MTSTFWGLRLEPGKRYSTTVEKSFHVSMAALDCNSVKNDKDIHSVMLKEGESDIPFILCNLQKPKILQVELNHQFETGDRITFFSTGSGTIHLTGYIIPDEDDLAQFGEEGDEEDEVEEEEDDEEEDDDDEEDEVSTKISKLNGLAAKRKGKITIDIPAKKKKAQALEEDSDDSGEDEEVEEEESDSENDEGAEAADSDDGMELDVKKKGSPSPTKTEQPQQQLSKKKKKQLLQQQKTQNPGINGPQQSSQTKKNQSDDQSQQKTKNEKGAAGTKKQVLEGGVSIQELKVGNGPICKPGKMATVYYTGRLKTNNKVFDSTTQGAGFKFRVGRGEVIKGWDVGLTGMKVGGKRLITCPPNMGYGQKGMPPTIPGNSALVFEVELKGVN